jgi:glycosyltransferase involved in cell wall biosynthesis
MKILQIHPLLKSEAVTPSAGGMARVALTLTRLLLENGHEAQVLPIPERIGSRLVWELAPGRPADVPPVLDFPAAWDFRWWIPAIARLQPMPRGPRALAYDIMALVGLRRAVQSFRPDLVHNHLARAHFPRLARALRLDPPIVLTHHHGAMGEGLGAYDRIAFPAEEARRNISAQSRYPERRTRCIYNPVESAFVRGEVPEASERSGIYFVGAVRTRKGIDLLLEAYRLEPRLHDEPLFICGTGESDELVERAAREEKLPIVRQGHLTVEEVAARLRKAKLIVIPSRMETLCTALVEAVCVGTPVVGWAPTVRELETGSGLRIGLPFDGRTQTAAELASAILEARESGFCRTEQRVEMAAWARGVFSEAKFLQAYLSFYREIL